VIERAAALPGVRSAAVTTFLPMSGPGTSILFNIKGRPVARPDNYAVAGFRAVSGRYFETIGVPVVRGRLLDPRDRQSVPRVIVINESMARQFFPGEDPLGHRIQLGGLPDPDPANPYMEVVGIVGDVRQQPDADAKAEMYVPYAQYPDAFLRRMYMNVNVVVRTNGSPAALAGPLREIVREVDRDQPLVNVRTLGDVVAASVAQPRFRTLLLGVFAAIALALAGIGVYGLLAHAVAQRTNEFGVRMALGAPRSGVLRLVLRQGLVLAASGVAIGLVAALVAVRALQTVLFEITPWDPAAWIVSSAAILAVAFLATWLPARRALRVDPVIALRA
jgi:predicted permease